MVSSLGRVSVVVGGAGAVLATLLGVTYLQFGTRWGSQTPLLQYFVVSVLVGFLVLGWVLSWRQRIVGLVAVLGVIAFVFGVYGGTVGCNALGYPQDAAYGFTYDWGTNQLKFGDHTERIGYRCRATPYRGVVLIGAALATGGTLLLLHETPAVWR